MTKKYLVLAASTIATLMLAGAGCSSNVEQNKMTDDTSSQTPTTQTNFATAPGEIKEFTVTAKNWQFDPGTITVKTGDRVRLKITSVDVAHSFMLKDYNLNVKLDPGQTQVVEFVADKAGEFSFRCGVPCGEGHRDMTGKFIVQ